MGGAVAEVFEGDQGGFEVEGPAELIAEGGVRELVEEPVPFFLENEKICLGRRDGDFRSSCLLDFFFALPRLGGEGQFLHLGEPFPELDQLCFLVSLPFSLFGCAEAGFVEKAVSFFLLRGEESVGLLQKGFQFSP